MRIPGIQVAGAMLMASGVALLTTACGNFLIDRSAEKTEPSRNQQSPQQQRIVQINFGSEAAYAVCAEPACPAVTPKTIASTEQASAPPVAQVATPAANTSSDIEASTASSDTAASARYEHMMVHFPLGASTLNADAKHALDKMIPVARNADRIVISGRTDNIGNTKVNDAIALARALHVRNYMRDQLLDVPNTIEIDAKGSCCFISKNDTPDGRKENRRVEVVFTLRG